MSTKGIGARLTRKEDGRYMRGRGNFVGDMAMSGLKEVAFLRSPVAHARIEGIEIPDAIRAQVFHNADMEGVRPMRPAASLPGYKQSDFPALAAAKVRYVGEMIAACVADTRAEAEDLAEQVIVDFDELPVLVNIVDAQKPGAALIHEEWGDNIFLVTSRDDDIEAVAKTAAVKVTRTYDMARQAMNPMEGAGCLAYWDERMGQLVLYSSTQAPHLIRTGLSQHLELEQRQVRVIAPDVGGGFGYKCCMQPEELAVAWLAIKLGHPVRWLQDRREHLVACANSRQHHYQVTAYADEKGKVLATDVEVTVDVGAYSVWPFTAVLEASMAGGNLAGPYGLEVCRYKTLSVATNKPPFIPYRGVARAGVCFATELTIDAIAREIGREPHEVRLENLVTPDMMPYTNILNKHLDSGDYPECLRRAVDSIGLAAVRERQAAGEEDGRKVGVGIGMFTEQTAHGTSVFSGFGIPLIPGFEQAKCRVTPDGGLEIYIGVHSHGQGMETTMAQVANEILGIDPDFITVVHGDTESSPYSTGSYASRAAVMVGGAISRTCKILAERLGIIGAHLLQCGRDEVEVRDGKVVGPRGEVSIADVARIWYLNPDQLPDDADPGGLEATGGYKPKVDTGSFTYSAHAAVVAVDVEIGAVELLDYVVVEDCGTMINPLVVEGQAYGGTAQGIGTGLYEESPYDENGQPLASTFMDYIMPGATEVPDIRMVHMETPSPYTDHGIKGAGETAAIAPAAAIANAVNDALRDLGAEIKETPMSPRRVLAALADARKAAG
jgi:carbon-monoxide dehydrogenase large subunit